MPIEDLPPPPRAAPLSHERAPKIRCGLCVHSADCTAPPHRVPRAQVPHLVDTIETHFGGVVHEGYRAELAAFRKENAVLLKK